MTTLVNHSGPAEPSARTAGPAIIAVAVLMALGCLAFAAVNVVFEATDRFAEGRYAEYAAGLSVMNWVVTGLKLLGAAVALLSVSARPIRFVTPRVMSVLLWGAFATLALDAVGSTAEAGMILAGVSGVPGDLGMRSVAYLLGSIVSAAGFGVLAVSYLRRHAAGRRTVPIGLLGAPVLLGLLFSGLPGLLVLLGVMPPA
ncbi:hypothetical protein [Nocardioides sp.]|uniref:hypothetical protein n=1 Tax=Nocardioides sp. TaxID=35761 RepID=UPI0019A5345E|nr:hypothetical protein [Nocardioides sp.]MBC7279267.1 hypothetical protein [Nocardioides sp.]